MSNPQRICFEKGGFKSVVLYDHWGGDELINIAKEYVKDLNATVADNGTPLGRRDADVVMVDFIRHYIKHPIHGGFFDKRVASSLRLEQNNDDCYVVEL